LVGRIYGRSPIKIDYFVPIHKQTWPPQAILVSDWLIFIFFSNEAVWPMKPNLAASIYGKSSVAIAASHQVSVHLAKRFQRRRFLEIDQLEAIIACGSHIC
jgi:hypothetical protein